MIEFMGVLSEKTQLDKTKRNNRNFNIVYSLMTGAGFILFVLISLICDYFKEVLGIIILYVGIVLIILFLNNRVPKKRLLRFKIDTHIKIQGDQLQTAVWQGGKKVWKIKTLVKVKKVLDVGECYYIIFKFGDISNAWVCQKDLLVEGTIAEFEKLFEDKLVRK